MLGRDDPAALVREARKAIKAIDGVTDVSVEVVEPDLEAVFMHLTGRALRN